MANKWLKQLKAYDDAVNYEYDSFAEENCLYTPSPYWNSIFANKSHGMPKNSTVLEYSEPKAGKSLGIYAMVDEMHRRDKEGIAIVFNTEHRGQLQHNLFPTIDKERFQIYDTNDPVEIFDRIENDIKPMVQDGMPLRLLAIDSLTNIMGIKRGDADSVSQHLMGDRALTIQIGLSKLIPFCKRNKILHVATEQMRANLDGGYGGPKEKAAASWNTKHTYEYAISFRRLSKTDEGKQEIEEKTFDDDELKDSQGNPLRLGHKVFVRMEGNSIGQTGRSGVFTLDYQNGIINQHEEIFWMAKNTGIITLSGITYTFGKESFTGKKECANAIREDKELASAILFGVKQLDAKR